MRRAFIAPLLLRAPSYKAVHLRATHSVHNAHIRRYTRGARRYSMSLEGLEKFQTTPFPECVDLATRFLNSLPGTLTPAHEERLRALLSRSDGTRGLFVALLSTEEITLAETPVHEGLFEIIGRSTGFQGTDGFSGEEVVVLAVKNVTMSGAMVITYTRYGETELARGSEMTRRRAVNVLKVLDGVNVAREMVRGLRNEEGRFGGFGRKWGYVGEEIGGAVQGLREAFGDAVLE